MKFLYWSLALLIILCGFLLNGCSSFGSNPSNEDVERFKQSKNFNHDESVFQNRRPELMKKMDENFEFWATIKKMLKTDDGTVPKEKLIEVKPDIAKFLIDEDELKSIWFGHSSFLLNMNGIVVLVDPIFSDYAAPVNLMVKRFQDPVLKLEELPKVDYIVISHDHYDHLDMKTVKFFVDKNTHFVTPLGVGSHLQEWGISKNRITENDWWEEAEFESIKFIATPAQHFSGRGLFNKNYTLWASWVIQSKDHKVFFSGDSGYDIHFKEIGEKLGPFDVAFIESGQYNPMWEAVHLMPNRFVTAFRDLKAKRYFPVHWGMFKLSIHPWSEPADLLYEYSKKENFELLVPKLGEILNVKNPGVLHTWWLENQ